MHGSTSSTQLCPSWRDSKAGHQGNHRTNCRVTPWLIGGPDYRSLTASTAASLSPRRRSLPFQLSGVHNSTLPLEQLLRAGVCQNPKRHHLGGSAHYPAGRVTAHCCHEEGQQLNARPWHSPSSTDTDRRGGLPTQVPPAQAAWLHPSLPPRQTRWCL